MALPNPKQVVYYFTGKYANKHIFEYEKRSTMLPNYGLRDEIHQLHAHLCGGLADPNRILILYTLYEAPCNVSELAQATKLPQPSVSRHLRVLRESGLVTGQREGHSIIYKLTDERVIEALDILRNVLAATLKKQGALSRTALEESFERN